MKRLVSLLVCMSYLTISTDLSAQDSLKNKKIVPFGISLEYGFGSYAVTDEYISKEKYSGSMPFYEINWTTPHENYTYSLNMKYQNSSTIKNYNLSADIHQFTLSQGFNYRLSSFKLFNKNVYMYLGPANGLSFYYNKQKIAVSGFDYSQSTTLLISGSINTNIYYNLSDNLNLEARLCFDLLSLGFKMTDMEESDDSPVKLLTLLSGSNIDFRFGARYYLYNNLSLKLAYIFLITRIESWDPLLSASDNLIVSLTYGF